jgi:hypothetical protein
VLTAKYAEGYPGKRYYGGCEAGDVAERLAIARAKASSAEHANVQPPRRFDGQPGGVSGLPETGRQPRFRFRSIMADIFRTATR